MPAYIVLYKFTDQGIKNVKSTLERVREAQADSICRDYNVYLGTNAPATGVWVESMTFDALTRG